jgi:hypothetical protein
MTLELQPGGRSPPTITKSEGSTPSTEAIEVRDESDESLFRVRMAAKLEVQRIK